MAESSGRKPGNVTGKGMSAERAATRQRWGKVEAEKDRRWLAWIGRFRFVTAELLGLRFGVNLPNARKRVRRLEAAGLVGVHRTMGQPSAIVLTPKGAQHVDMPRRLRQPRPDLHREHELAIVETVAKLELAAAAGVEVLTERDCRQRTAEGRERYSVEVADDRGRATDRWPDVVLLAPAGKVAIEIEFAPKHSERLARILYGYLRSDLVEVRFLVVSPRLASTLRRMAAQERDKLSLHRAEKATRIVVDAWTTAAPADRDAIRAQAA
jgi:ribosomal protein S25